MIRPLKFVILIAALALVVGASFAGGRQLRRVAAGPLHRSARLTSLRGEGISGVDLVAASDASDDSSPGETFQTVYQYIKSDYVDRVDNDAKLSNGAVKRMLLSLDDPHTRFLEPAQLKELEDQLNGTYTGIGATVTVVKEQKNGVDYRRLAVVAPAIGGPSDKAGMQPGDLITSVDGKWVIAYDPRSELDGIRNSNKSEAEKKNEVKDLAKRFTEGITLTKALDLLDAKDGKAMELTLERKGSPTPIKVKLTTATVTVDPVEFRSLGGDAAYLRVTEFSNKAAAAIPAALQQAAGKRLVLDLRDNSGGPVSGSEVLPKAAQELLSQLTKGGPVGTVVRKGNTHETIDVAAGAGWRAPIAVLVNGGTANTAELVASVLKEKAGAKLLGSHTFGDSVFEKLVTLRDGTAMTLTAGKLLTSDGQEFAGKGLQPDVAMDAGSPQPGNDPVVDRAASALAGA